MMASGDVIAAGSGEARRARFLSLRRWSWPPHVPRRAHQIRRRALRRCNLLESRQHRQPPARFWRRRGPRTQPSHPREVSRESRPGRRQRQPRRCHQLASLPVGGWRCQRRAGERPQGPSRCATSITPEVPQAAEVPLPIRKQWRRTLQAGSRRALTSPTRLLAPQTVAATMTLTLICSSSGAPQVGITPVPRAVQDVPARFSGRRARSQTELRATT